MKKILAIVLALAMILSLAACGSKAEETKPAESVKTTEAAKTETVKEEKEPVTLEFLCWGAAEETTADAFKAMLDGFMEKYPWITVEVTESNYDAVNTSLDGHQYSATWITQPFALYCNSDLLAAAGYDHTPTTWDELIEMSYAVAALGKNADGNTVYGRTLGTKVLANAGYMSLIDVWANGGDYYAEDGTIAYGDEATVAALTEMQKEIQEGVIAAGNQIVDNRTLFGNGQVAFHIDAPSQLKNWTEVNVTTSLIPGSYSFSSDHHIIASANTEHPEECALFIDYMTGIEAMEKYTSFTDVMPGRTSVEALDYYKNLNDNMSVFYKAAAQCKALPVNSSNFVAAMELLATAVQRVTIGNEDPATVAAETHDQLVEMYK